VAGGDHYHMWWSRPADPGLGEIVELLEGVATILMEIDAKLEAIQTILEER
jgi:hypothetical protein